VIICENAHKCTTICGHKEYHDVYSYICDVPCYSRNGIKDSLCISKLEYEMRRAIREKEKRNNDKN
jgi:hypothetical protein